MIAKMATEMDYDFEKLEKTGPTLLKVLFRFLKHFIIALLKRRSVSPVMAFFCITALYLCSFFGLTKFRKFD